MPEAAPDHASADIPVHVAIIMDGNGRWARSRGLPRIAGHRRGADAVREATRAAGELGIKYLTLFGFSSENWRRPLTEVEDLMGLLRRYLRSEISELHRNGVRLRVIGNRDRLAKDIRALIEDAEQMTGANTGLNLVIALSYGGRDDIVRATQALAARVRDGELAAEDIDETQVSGALSTHDIPDPDLLIRTSGEQRISNFLLWQCAYAELMFTDTLWPDFTRQHLADAVMEFGRRERRYGLASHQLS